MLTERQKQITQLIFQKEIRSFHDLILRYIVNVKGTYNEAEIAEAIKKVEDCCIKLMVRSRAGDYITKLCELKPTLESEQVKELMYELTSLLSYLEEHNLILLIPDSGHIDFVNPPNKEGAVHDALFRRTGLAINRLKQVHPGKHYWYAFDIVPLASLNFFVTNDCQLREEVALAVAVEAQKNSKKSQQWTTAVALASIILSGVFSLISILLAGVSIFLQLRPIVAKTWPFTTFPVW